MKASLDNPKEELDAILSFGIFEDIFMSEQCIFLLDLIAEYAELINNAKFGRFFGNLQIILNRQFILSLTSLFEFPKRRGRNYPIRSIPFALEFLSQKAGCLDIPERATVIERLGPQEYEQRGLKDLPNKDLTQRLAKYYQSKLPRHDTLNALKYYRDKRVAHNELVGDFALPKIKWPEAEDLFSYAKDFLQVVGKGYLSIIYILDDAKRTSISLKRLLNKAGIMLADLNQ